ncbi:MAG TPA: cytochrome P450 [Sphingopyxis sp.]|uniref:cytochrome P450 n=1 Tax=Sphingopyxis sp. TaxID=1908224 RepID=UPI002E37D5C5|nr:cytochrome P450 [Sphingopyxis sp.]HEX2813842.1 cytochrome P450 [Sphingopyxis sp.]
MKEAKTCPVDGVVEVDMNSEAFAENFKDIYTRMHASGCPYAHSTVGDFYAIGKHQDITKACTNTKLWSSKLGPALQYQSPETPGVLVSVDPPEHTFEARLVGKAFSKTYFESFIPGIKAFLNERIDSFIANGRCDIHKEISEPLPLWVIFAMFGKAIDDEGIDAYREAFVGSIGQMLATDPLARPSRNPYADSFLSDHLVDVKRKLASGEAQPDDNLLTRFITTEIDGQRLTDDKILAFCNFLLAAGSGTTTILLSGLLYQLLNAPEQFEKLKANPDLVPLAIEESLRVESPLHGLFRTNNEEVTVGPLTIKPDTKVMMMWAAANLDPTVFPNPEKFDLDRDLADVRKHLAFGYGIHICRGAPLSRIEARLFLETILERLPNLRLDGPMKKDRRIPIFNGIGELPVAWDV